MLGLKGHLTINAAGAVRASLKLPGTTEELEFTGSMGINRISNLSTRARVGGADNQLISGFVIAGSGSKRILIRAMGPALSDTRYGIDQPLADPLITLVRNGVVIAQVDNWEEAGTRAELLDVMARVGAFPATAGSKDAMLLVDLQPGIYTAVISGREGGTGTGLAEIYAVDDLASRDSRLVNISSRAFVGTGESVMITGFVTSGSIGRRVLVRAIGATLGKAPHNVSGVLDDPIIHIYHQGVQTLVATNDDWDEDPERYIPANYIESVSAGVGAFRIPRGSTDAAVILHVSPNTAYTVVISGKNGATGVVLAEIYEVDALP
jgi:hypothetical protein